MKFRSLAMLLPVASLLAADPFPELKDIPAALRLEPNPAVAIDKDGNYLVNGKIRYLAGVQLCPGPVHDTGPTEGYPPELKWLYEAPLQYESAQRLGFDTVSTFASLRHLLAKKPKIVRENELAALDRLRASGLPQQVDFTGFPWGAGSAREFLPPEAVNQFHSGENNHWVSFNIFHPAGRAAYCDYWRSGAKDAVASGSPILMYELFNEPAYDEPSEYNRALFAKFLAKKYGSVDRLNAIWRSKYPSFEAAAQFKTKTEFPGLRVDWSKFLEEGFADLCRLGVKTIREVDPSARFCVQIMGRNLYRSLPRSNINLYLVNQEMQTVSAPTGGGIDRSGGLEAAAKAAIDTPANSPGLPEGILQRHFFRALADGKPIHNGECYTGRDYQATLNIIWLDFLRGSSATYLFEWSKRAWDWKPRGSAEGGKAVAERYPWMILNPYAYPAEGFLSIMAAKREIFQVQEYFARGRRHADAETAILLSFPTERYSAAVGKVEKNEVTHLTAALEFSHYGTDVILEEQLTENRQERYKAIAAMGVGFIYPETAARLESFVEKGGVLILGRDFMRLDEYGNPAPWKKLPPFTVEPLASPATGVLSMTFPQAKRLPGAIKGRNDRRITDAAQWEAIGSFEGTPALFRARLGKGTVYLFTPEMQDYALASLMGGLLSQHGIEPRAEIIRAAEKDLAVNLELHASFQPGKTLLYLYNSDRYPKLVRVKPRGQAYSSAAELFAGRALPMNAEGALALVEPQQRLVLCFGDATEFGTFAPVTEAVLEKEYADQLKVIETEREKRREANFRYLADPAMLKTIDLRAFCNRGFIDQVSDDGKGGWTDQGRENSLVGVPWGVTELLGIPCDLIRNDENEDKTCIVMASPSQKGELPKEVKGIPVGAKVKALYFFHTAAWCTNQAPAMSYRIRYAGGKTLEVPVIVGVNLWDWWLRDKTPFVAWRNRENRGFHCWRWENPEPELAVDALDIVSANSKVVPIVIGVTAELYDGVRKETVPFEKQELVGFSKAAVKTLEDGFELEVSAETSPWAGVLIRNRGLAPLGLQEGDVIRFEIRGGKDRFGNAKGGQKLQFTGRIYERGKVGSPAGKWVSVAAGNDPETFQRVEIPLKALLSDKLPAEQINGFILQFRGTGADSGVVVRNFTIERRLP